MNGSVSSLCISQDSWVSFLSGPRVYLLMCIRKDRCKTLFLQPSLVKGPVDQTLVTWLQHSFFFFFSFLFLFSFSESWERISVFMAESVLGLQSGCGKLH